MSDPSTSPRTAFQPPPTLIPTPAGGAPSLIPGDSQGVDNDVTDHLKVQLLVRAYQVQSYKTRTNIRSEVITKPKSIPWG
jgi:2-oxoglutarate dehydrogenase E1 component